MTPQERAAVWVRRKAPAASASHRAALERAFVAGWRARRSADGRALHMLGDRKILDALSQQQDQEGSNE